MFRSYDHHQAENILILLIIYMKFPDMSEEKAIHTPGKDSLGI
jgi:hypothetical protein